MSGRPPLQTLQRAAMAIFRDHRRACPKCQLVDVDQPRTLVEACLDGSAMLKDAYNEIWHADRAKRERAAGGAT